MEWVETTGRTLEEAREAALDQLGVDETDAEFEVLEQPRAGLFGRMRGEARVRARVKPTAPRAKEDRRDRRRRSKSAAGSGAAGGAAPSGPGGGGAGGGTQPAGTAAQAPASPADRAEAAASTGSTAEVASTSGAGGAPSGSRRRRRRRSKSGTGSAGGGGAVTQQGGADAREGVADAEGGGAVAGRTSGDSTAVPVGHEPSAPRTPRPSETESNQRRDGAEVEVPLQEQGRVAEDFLSGLLSEFGLTAQVALDQRDEDNLDIALTGHDLGLLIGQKGTTLLAVQDLARTVVQHKTGATNGRIHVDIGGYRQKRSEALAKFARDVAAKVKQSGQRTVLEPMTAADRKVVHDAITEIEGVATTSEGEEPRRRVVVIPSE